MDKPIEIHINTRGCSEPLNEKTAQSLGEAARKIHDHYKAKMTACGHDRLNEDGFCRSCGADCRGIN